MWSIAFPLQKSVHGVHRFTALDHKTKKSLRFSGLNPSLPFKQPHPCTKHLEEMVSIPPYSAKGKKPFLKAVNVRGIIDS